MSDSKNTSPDARKVDSEFEIDRERKSAKESLKRKFGLSQILGKSKANQELHEKIDKISLCDVSVLISGESGTGKELAARAIHYLSCRAGKPFIPVNCGAIPETLFENELFGHVKGAFTDAAYHQIGLVGEAEGGTIFLDEISAINPYIQVKLLRLLQDKEYKTLGDPKPRQADIRIIAATNRDLEGMVRELKFREDLFYRLNIVSLHIHSLRERKEDIPILVRHFLEKYSKKYNKPVKKMTEDAMSAFISHSWPGNVRELENRIQQIIVMSSDPVIDPKIVQFPHKELGPTTHEFEHFSVAKSKAIDLFEKTYLSQLLTRHRGDVVTAARRAGKSRTGLWNLLKKHNLSPKQFRC
jgi:transcriptional regulator with PAS, ATPase and Fis domain